MQPQILRAWNACWALRLTAIVAAAVIAAWPAHAAAVDPNEYSPDGDPNALNRNPLGPNFGPVGPEAPTAPTNPARSTLWPGGRDLATGPNAPDPSPGGITNGPGVSLNAASSDFDRRSGGSRQPTVAYPAATMAFPRSAVATGGTLPPAAAPSPVASASPAAGAPAGFANTSSAAPGGAYASLSAPVANAQPVVGGLTANNAYQAAPVAPAFGGSYPTTPDNPTGPVYPTTANPPAAYPLTVNPQPTPAYPPATNPQPSAAYLPPAYALPAYAAPTNSPAANPQPSPMASYPVAAPGAVPEAANQVYCVPGTPGPGAFRPGAPNAVPAVSPVSMPAANPSPSPRAASKPLSPADDPRLQPLEGAEILARVGGDVVLACDILPEVNEAMAKVGSKLSPMEYESRRLQVLQEKLMERVQFKLVLEDIRREQSEEALKSFDSRLESLFNDTQIEPLMKRLDASNREELIVKLRAEGSSIEHEQQAFSDRMLAQQWMRQKVKVDDEIALDAVLEYYHKHLADFETPEQARWEELMARHSNYASRQAALDAIVAMGNEVMSGKTLSAVAKARSEGPTASDGGQRGWDSRGSLASPELDKALFGLPLNQLSQIIETKQGFHIIRVVQRKPAARTSFQDAYKTIRDKIKDQRTVAKTQEFMKTLQDRTPVALLLKEYIQSRMKLQEQQQQRQEQQQGNVSSTNPVPNP